MASASRASGSASAGLWRCQLQLRQVAPEDGAVHSLRLMSGVRVTEGDRLAHVLLGLGVVAPRFAQAPEVVLAAGDVYAAGEELLTHRQGGAMEALGAGQGPPRSSRRVARLLRLVATSEMGFAEKGAAESSGRHGRAARRRQSLPGVAASGRGSSRRSRPRGSRRYAGGASCPRPRGRPFQPRRPHPPSARAAPRSC